MCAGPYSLALLGIGPELSDRYQAELELKADNEVLRPGQVRISLTLTLTLTLTPTLILTLTLTLTLTLARHCLWGAVTLPMELWLGRGVARQHRQHRQFLA